MSITLTPEQIEAMKRHAMEDFPREACGLVVATGDYLRVENCAVNPEAEFSMPEDTLLKYDARLIFHSHPGKYLACPSAADMRSQIVTDLPWALCGALKEGASAPFIWGDGYIPPLLGREFRHGPSGSDGKGDCYALIKDWYKQARSVELPEFPRDDLWWEHGDRLYDGHFAEAGFCDVGLISDPQVGDVAFMAVNSKEINHAAVYVGDGLILHHLYNRLSRHEPAGRWRKMIRRWVRYEEKDNTARLSAPPLRQEL